MTSAIPKCYLFTDIFRNSENVDGCGPSIAFLEKDFIWTMGNVGKKNLQIKDQRICVWAKIPILVACFLVFLSLFDKILYTEKDITYQGIKIFSSQVDFDPAMSDLFTQKSKSGCVASNDAN